MGGKGWASFGSMCVCEACGNARGLGDLDPWVMRRKGSGFCSWGDLEPAPPPAQGGSPRGGQVLEAGGEFLQVSQSRRPNLSFSHRETCRESQCTLREKGRSDQCGKKLVPSRAITLPWGDTTFLDSVQGLEKSWGSCTSFTPSFIHFLTLK